MTPPGFYAGRRVVLATMHSKEQAIAPAFQEHLRVSLTVSPGLDTDRLGTFTGEVQRAGTMLDAAVAKAHAGMELMASPLALASEGSFGPHPLIPFVAGGMELMVFVDRELGIAVHETMVSRTTNFAHCVVLPDGSDTPDGAVDRFLDRVGFPAHGVIVRPNVGDINIAMAKGVQDPAHAHRCIALAASASTDGRARIETDMRAHMNPTRLAELGPLAERLARRLATICPSCSAPGWGGVDVITGLPCEECGTFTDLVAAEVHGCAACDHRAEVGRHDGLRHATAAQCPECNP